jgi:platelet-activating factor acetylhydrolase IB subunit alpha
LELETKTSQLEEELNHGKRRNDKTEALPRAPATFDLVGHRGNVNAVAFHPVFSQIASASEDATIKIWDYETGEFERTLKGHTNAVQDLAYDHTGNLLGKKGFEQREDYLCLDFNSFFFIFFSIFLFP